MKIQKYIQFVFIFLLFSNSTHSQSCCSGGVPLSSNLGMAPDEANTLQLNLAYDLNVLETLKSGMNTLEDDSRSRKTHSALLQAGYSFTNTFSVDVLFSWVRQERNINQFGSSDFTSTQGLGDAVFLFKQK